MTIPSDRKLAIDWYKGCNTEEEKRSRENLIRNSVQFSEVLLRILADRFTQVERKGLREEDYESAGWMTLQAYRNGRMAELQSLAELFTHLTTKGNSK